MPTEAFIKKHVPAGSFLGQYMKMCEPLETSREYDFWCGMWALGTALGRGVIVPRPHAPIHMNWYIMLVAASGITRKSTSVRIARDLVRQLDIPMVETRASSEFLWDTLTSMEEARLAIAVSELVTFLGKSNYAMEIPGMLTDLYDCPETRSGGGTMLRGAREMRDVYITFLSASTPSWLGEAINPAVVEGGFTSRCLFITADQPKHKVPWPTDAEISSSALLPALHSIQSQAVRTPLVELLPDAMDRYSTWYKGRDLSSQDPFVQSFQSREDSHMLRAAACLAINDGSFAVYRSHINAAIQLIREVKSDALTLFHDTGVPQKFQLGINRVTELLANAGSAGLGHSQLYLRTRHYLRGDEFNMIMLAMHEHGMVAKIEDKTPGRAGRAPIRYIRSDKLMNRGSQRALRENLVG